MTREEKIKMAIEKGYTCNPETGEVFGVKGGVIKKENPEGYRIFVMSYNNKSYSILQHQFIWYWTNKKVVNCIDHINGVKNDNKINNLRSVTNQQNSFNTKAKGYTYYKPTKKWISRIMVSGNPIHLGYFKTEEEAREAYLKAKEKYHQI